MSFSTLYSQLCTYFIVENVTFIRTGGEGGQGISRNHYV